MELVFDNHYTTRTSLREVIFFFFREQGKKVIKQNFYLFLHGIGFWKIKALSNVEKWDIVDHICRDENEHYIVYDEVQFIDKEHYMVSKFNGISTLAGYLMLKPSS